MSFKKALLWVCVFVLCSVIVVSGVLFDVATSCEVVSESVYEDVVTYKDVEVCDKVLFNCSMVRVVDTVSSELRVVSHDVCEGVVEVEGVVIPFEKKGYNCKKDVYNNVIICDSCVDGNCDGICSPNGGETCIKIESNGDLTHKNSITEWKNTHIFTERFDKE